VILFFTGTANFEGSTLVWSLVASDGTGIQTGSEKISQQMTPGLPQELCKITCDLPPVQKATEFRLEISLHHHGSAIINHWPLWVYPNIPATPENLGVYDPLYLLDDWGEWLAGISRVNTRKDFLAYEMLLTTILDEELLRFVGNGGKLLLLQQGDGSLPNRRCPFWRESIILFPDHPLWETFPQAGYADMKFFGIATDIAFDSSRLAASLPGMQNLRPIMRRLDAREFHMSEYLFEVGIGMGNLIGCSLRIQGGMGVQPYGLKRNIAGSALLSMLLAYMEKM
jgi:hypothetical protein